MTQYLVVHFEHHLQMTKEQRKAISCVSQSHSVHLALKGVFSRFEKSEAVVKHVYHVFVDLVGRAVAHQF